MTEIARADASASRSFFVRMLTRDISVEDCILDLIDNSVDRAWAKQGHTRLGLSQGPDFSNTKIDLQFSPESFRIIDNCGGMTLETAKRYAFTFGRKDEPRDEEADYSIGVYGIGLKRAVFKLGAKIAVESSYSDAGMISGFRVPIDVKKWVGGKGNDWDFPIEEIKANNVPGLDIFVTKLTDLAKATFEDTLFEDNLRDTIGRDYALHIHHGLTVIVNGKRVQGDVFELLAGGGFEPLYEAYEEKIGADTVFVEIAAGLAFPPPNSNEPNEDRGEREEKSGWYVACNGRVVMAADKSALSVWGDDFPFWHPQYTGFFGIILFSSENRELLPLTTTKRSVDLSSVVYRRARPRMKIPTRTWIDYTNSRKSELAAAEKQEQGAAKTVIFALQQHPTVVLPKVQRKGPKETIIQYRMPMTRVKNLARGFGNSTLSNKDIGIRSFEYAYQDLAEEE